MTYVYMAKVERFVKIGLSDAPLVRINNIASNAQSHPEIVDRPVLIHAAVGNRQDEKCLHLALQEYRIIGEWYRDECLEVPELIAFLNKPPSFGVGLATFRLPARVHREIKVEAAHSGRSISNLISEAWERYKEAVPQPWRDRKRKSA